MILSTVLKPPEAAREASGVPGAGARVLQTRRRRNRQYQRLVAMGVIASVVVHLLVIFASPLVVQYIEPILNQFYYATQPPLEGIQVVELRVTETPRPQPEPEPERPEPEREPPVGRVADGEAPAASAADVLRPRVGDLRLWVPRIRTERREASPAEKTAMARLRVYEQIMAMNDSAAAAAARDADAMDWTVGEEGGKWGVSPGKIHLGPLGTLPLPVAFGPNRDEAAERAEWEAIRRQADQGAIDESIEDRIEAIRERRQSEGSSSGDTTSRD